MSSAFSDIPRALRQGRREHGVSQASLAESLGFRQATISRAEQGGDIRLFTLVQIARALDLEPLLVPRRLVPAIQAVVFSPDAPAEEDDESVFS